MAKKKAMTTDAAIIPGTPGQEMVEAEKLMQTPTRQFSDTWAKENRSYAEKQVQSEFRIAKKMLEIEQDQDKYGSNALSLLCTRHNISKWKLDVYLTVARNITDEMITDIIEYNKSNDALYQPIFFTHVHMLAGLGKPSDISNYLGVIKKEKLSTAALEDRLREERQKATGGVPQVFSPKKVADSGTRGCRQLKKKLAVVDEDFLDTVMRSSDIGKTCESLMEVEKEWEDTKSFVEPKMKIVSRAIEVLKGKSDQLAIGHSESEDDEEQEIITAQDMYSMDVEDEFEDQEESEETEDQYETEEEDESESVVLEIEEESMEDEDVDAYAVDEVEVDEADVLNRASRIRKG